MIIAVIVFCVYIIAVENQLANSSDHLTEYRGSIIIKPVYLDVYSSL